MTTDGQRFGDYAIERTLARGGMAEVFIARLMKPGFEKRVCLKCVLPEYSANEEFARLFRDEAALAARLHHPNIVETFDFGEVEGRLFLAMELIDGGSVSDLLRVCRDGGRQLPVPFALHIAALAARGVGYAHGLKDDLGRSLHVVHRDVSPSNVLVGREGDVKVADFGVAQAAHRMSHAESAHVRGKLAYMSPEQLEGDVDARTDQFALAVVLWEMLTGRRLFDGDPLEVKKQIASSASVPLASALRSGVPPAVDAVLAKALSRFREDRFDDLAAFESKLSALAFELAHRREDVDPRHVVQQVLTDFPGLSTRTQQAAPRSPRKAAPRAPPPAPAQPAAAREMTTPTAALPPAPTPEAPRRRRRPRPPFAAMAAGVLVGFALLAVVLWVMARSASGGQHEMSSIDDGELALAEAEVHLRARNYEAARRRALDAIELGSSDNDRARNLVEAAMVSKATEERLGIARGLLSQRKYESAYDELSRLPRSGPVNEDVVRLRDQLVTEWATHLEASAERAHRERNKRSLETVMYRLKTIDPPRHERLAASFAAEDEGPDDEEPDTDGLRSDEPRSDEPHNDDP